MVVDVPVAAAAGAAGLVDDLRSLWGITGVSELVAVIIGAVLAGRAGRRRDRLQAERDRELEDRKYWREQSHATYLKVIAMARNTEGAIDAYGGGDPAARGWLDQGLPDEANRLADELWLVAPDEIYGLVLKLTVREREPKTRYRKGGGTSTVHGLNYFEISWICTVLRDHIRQHLGVPGAANPRTLPWKRDKREYDAEREHFQHLYGPWPDDVRPY